MVYKFDNFEIHVFLWYSGIMDKGEKRYMIIN